MITLPETNIVPENGWLEYDRFLLGHLGLFSGFRESIFWDPKKTSRTIFAREN